MAVCERPPDRVASLTQMKEITLRIMNNALNELILSVAVEGYWDWDLKEDRAYLSPRYCQLSGYSPADTQFDRRFFRAIIHPDDRDRVFRTIEEQLQGRIDVAVIEYRMLAKNGTVRWIEGRGRVVEHDERGVPVRMVGAIIDITKRKQAEREREQYYRFFQTSADLMCIADPHGNFIKTNPAFTELLGYSEEELVAKPLLDFVHPDDRQATLDEIARQQQRGFTDKFENRYLCRDGSVKWLSWRVNYSKDEAVAYASARDITERKRADEALREREEQLRVIFDTCQAGIILVDPQGKLLLANDRMAEMFGVPLGELIGSFYPEHVHPSERELGDDRMRQLIRGDILSVSVERHFLRADGSDFWGHLSGKRLENVDGSLRALVGFITDITEQHWARAELQRKNAEIEQFIYTVSHDLRSPLVTVKTFLGFLEQDLASSDHASVARDFEFIHSAMDGMKSLLNELLEVSRVGRVEAVQVSITVGELVAEALDALSGQIAEKQINVLVADTEVVLHGDRRHLRQIWRNLLENAVKYMGEQASPCIKIGRTEQSGESAFFVCDNGIGVAPAYQEKIFGMFEQLDKNSGGVGMGLALVKRIVELYGGHIRVESAGEGQGCCFWFTLPGALQSTRAGQ